MHLSTPPGGAASDTRTPPEADTSEARPSKLDSWFESLRAPVPSLSDLVVESRVERRARRFGWVAVTLAVGGSVCILGAAAVARLGARARSAALDARPVAVVASDSVEPGSLASETFAHHTAGTGALQVTSAPGQPIWVDGHEVGAGPMGVRLSCGPHDVRVGSNAEPRTVAVPCGGSVTLTP